MVRRARPRSPDHLRARLHLARVDRHEHRFAAGLLDRTPWFGGLARSTPSFAMRHAILPFAILVIANRLPAHPAVANNPFGAWHVVPLDRQVNG